MARGGINKAVVQTARLAILARGENPSIDAVRIEMGNTGSKTTIHRYLKELDESETRLTITEAPIDDELGELVARLAQRLKEKAQEPIDLALAQFEQQKTALLAQVEALEEAHTQLKQQFDIQAAALAEESAALQTVSTSLQTEQTRNAGLSQACSDYELRINDKDEQIRSLEEKHLHARDALEHYRNAIKEQREQEQRRHEGQLQQVQAELRQAQQSALVRQDEITQLHRDNERLLIEQRVTTKELNALQDQTRKDQAAQLKLNEHLSKIDSERALLQERLRVAALDSQARQEALLENQQRNKALELDLIKAQASIDALRLAAAVATAPETAQPS
ncbi:MULTISPECIES: DNA-binding protein [Pseudomonas]|jgi:myosin heavy subunit|uniref:Integrase n=1 Tax=Pseudomonas synxantha TaxID=47883 RepID=A0A5D3GEX8_9PSED|nr:MULTISPECIES: DNA-binding protein [Pseudomonas]KFF42366.1 integrase [Pseudomonas sp. BRG-100]MBY8971738.1 DNA-binding protein [Pseudomonas sp. P867]MCK3832656.1 DNA-binding protein [Pseudomonas fluorescens]MCK3840441.1 DNA-binding protein [Pseudomonas sp. NCIMB 10586]MCK3847063.1 DNA-binding protein [Pseudomonas sp. W15Feb34]